MATVADNLNYAYTVAPNASNWAQDNGTWTGNYSGDGIGQIVDAPSTYHLLRWIGSALASADNAVTLTCSSFDITASPGPGVRLQSGSRSGYVVAIEGGYNAKLYRLDSGAATELADLGGTTVDQVYTVELRAAGSTISVYIDSVLKASVTDSTYATGAPGICSFGGNSDFGGACLDWVATDIAVADEMPSGIVATDQLPPAPWVDYYTFQDGATPIRANVTDIPIQSSAAPPALPWHLVRAADFTPYIGFVAGAVDDGGAAIYDEAGEGQSPVSASGDDALTAIEAGQATAAATAGALDTFVVAEAGQSSALFVVSAADLRAMTDAGQATGAPTAAGLDGWAASDAGQALAPFVAGGADVASVTEAGGAIGTSSASVGDAWAMSDAGQASAALAASGSDVAMFTEAGSSVAPFVVSGDDAFSSAGAEFGGATAVLSAGGLDALTMGDAGQAVSSASASAADALTLIEAGAGISAGTATGADAQTMADAGQAAGAFLGGGAESVSASEAGGAASVVTVGALDLFALTDAGQAAGVFLGSGAAGWTMTEAGGVLLTGAAGAADIAAMMEEGAGVLLALGSGDDVFVEAAPLFVQGGAVRGPRGSASVGVASGRTVGGVAGRGDLRGPERDGEVR